MRRIELERAREPMAPLDRATDLARRLRSDRELWWGLAQGAAVVATGVAMRGLADRGWRAASSRPVPDDPREPDTDWRHAVAWAAVSGALVTAARLAVRGGTTALRRR